MTSGYPLDSVLAIDCGSILTRAVLIDVVEGRYRLVAQGEALSTYRAPHGNVMLGAARAIAEIERVTGRTVLDKNAHLIVPERGDGSGIDALVATASAGTPLRLFLVGLADAVSLASARQAILSGNATIVDTLSLEDGIDRPEGVQEALTRFERAQADVVLLVGGMDGSASARILDLASVLALGYQVTDFQIRPPVVYAGDHTVGDEITRILGDLCEVSIVDNVRPSMDMENPAPLVRELQRIYVERKLERLPGMASLAALSRVPVLPTNQARGHTLGYLSAHYGLNAINLDVGARQTTVSWARNGQGADLCTRNGWGIAAGRDIAAESGLDSVLRWLSEECDREEAMQVILNLGLYPGIVPGSRRELQITQALAREALRAVTKQARGRWSGAEANGAGWDLIVLSGSVLTHVSHPGQAALMALDTLQPVGVSALTIDVGSMASVAGVLATMEPFAAAQVLELDGFMGLGSIVAPVGQGKPGDLAVRVKMTYADGRALRVEVPCGSLEVIPLGLGQRASLELRTGRRFELGWPYRGRSARVEVDGGLLGVLIDARGRPLPSHRDVTTSQAHMQRWLSDIGA